MSSPAATVRSPAPGRARELAHAGCRVAGIDEVGRGAWAGPVVAAAVILPPRCELPGVRDSKLLTPPAREAASNEIIMMAEAVGIGLASVEEIDAQGLTAAVALAGQRALAGLGLHPDIVLLDGAHNYLSGCICETIIKGDASELCIAAASVVAKVHRDGLLVALDGESRQYGFADHKGYGTATHQQALHRHGVSPHHRRSYAPVQAHLV